MIENLSLGTRIIYIRTSETQVCSKTCNHLKAATTQRTNTHPAFFFSLHNGDSSFSAFEEGGGEEGSFAITSWRAAYTVFSAAHVLAGVLAVREGAVSHT